MVRISLFKKFCLQDTIFIDFTFSCQFISGDKLQVTLCKAYKPNLTVTDITLCRIAILDYKEVSVHMIYSKCECTILLLVEYIITMPHCVLVAAQFMWQVGQWVHLFLDSHMLYGSTTATPFLCGKYGVLHHIQYQAGVKKMLQSKIAAKILALMIGSKYIFQQDNDPQTCH